MGICSLVLFVLASVCVVVDAAKHRKIEWGTLLLIASFMFFAAELFNVGEQPVYDTSNVLKTVAHIDLSDRDDLELISADHINDVAYYVYVKPNRNVKINDTVYLLDNVEASLTSVDAVGFTFRCDIILEAGMSGTAIRNASGEQIGYVSKRLRSGEYYGIWS